LRREEKFLLFSVGTEAVGAKQSRVGNT